jgi:hypothetical protein
LDEARNRRRTSRCERLAFEDGVALTALVGGRLLIGRGSRRLASVRGTRIKRLAVGGTKARFRWASPLHLGQSPAMVIAWARQLVVLGRTGLQPWSMWQHDGAIVIGTGFGFI